MSIIVHRCECGAPHIYQIHRRGCPKHTFDGPSDLLVTRDNVTGEVVEKLVEPGTKSTAFGHPPLEMCGCADCLALYERLGGRIRAEAA